MPLLWREYPCRPGGVPESEVRMDGREQIIERARALEGVVAERLSRLVRLPSPSGGEEAVVRELARQLEDAGADEVRIDPLGNVIARLGNGPRVLAIDAHVDVVDVGNRANWSFEPFSGEIRDGFVLGRGAADQKGGAAAFVTAVEILRSVGVPEGLTLYLTGTVMEEDCDGLCWNYIVEEDGLRPDLVISTEPTSLNLYRGHRGRIEIEVVFRGVSAHGSAPERGHNAIYDAARVALGVEALNERLAVDPFLGKGSVTVSEFVSGAPSLCAVADSARIHLDRRLTWGETRESAVAEVEALLDERCNARVEVLRYHGRAWTGLEYGMEKYYPTWKLPEDHPDVARGVLVHKRLFGTPPTVDKWTFSTNGVTIRGIHGIPVIGFGPGDEVMAHAPDEKAPVEHLWRAAAFYVGYALAFGGKED